MNDDADAAWALGDFESAAAGFREAADRTRQLRFTDEESIGIALSNLAGLMIEQGKLDEAVPIAREALGLLQTVENAWILCDALALRLALLGKYEDAALLEGFVSSAYAAGGFSRHLNEARLQASLMAILRERLEEVRLDELLRAGATLNDKAAYRIAL